MINYFFPVLYFAGQKKEASFLLEDLVTPTERIIISKRLSIAYMLLQKYDYETISSILRVSRSTIGNASLILKVKGKGFRRIIDRIRKDESVKKILLEIQDAVEELITSGRNISQNRARSALIKRHREKENPF